jgi:hypothetical protein
MEERGSASFQQALLKVREFDNQSPCPGKRTGALISVVGYRMLFVSLFACMGWR